MQQELKRERSRASQDSSQDGSGYVGKQTGKTLETKRDQVRSTSAKGTPSKSGTIRGGVPQQLHERPKHVVLLQVRSTSAKGKPSKSGTIRGGEEYLSNGMKDLSTWYCCRTESP